MEAPTDQKIIGLKWIFKTKYRADGEIQKYKARIVAKGYSQEQGVDYDEVFSPVARIETVRMLLALAAHRRWKVYHLDVKSAFLNGDIHEDVYVEQPRGFEVCGEEHKVYKLRKALYGLKQAPRSWYSKIDSHFLDWGFQRSSNEHTLYCKTNQAGDTLVVCIYVDDIVFMSSSHSMLKEFKDDMMKNFEMSDLGAMSYFLGLEVRQDQLGIHISQKKYTEDLLKCYHMQGCKAAPTPLSENIKVQAEDGSGEADSKSYRSLVGKLMYLTHTRPDIVFAVNLLTRYMHKPSKNHYSLAKRVLRYLSGTLNHGIWYKRLDSIKLEEFTDSDWGGCVEDRKSTSGVVFNIGSGAISWMTKKQDITALSSTEAEYVALCAGLCQGIWLKRLLFDCGFVQSDPFVVWCDNKSCITIAKNPTQHGRTKHIDVKFHFIRDQVSQGVLELKYCSTDNQLADVFTKPLSVKKHVYMRELLGVCDPQSRGGIVGN